MLKLQIARLPVPELEFAGSAYFSNPRRGLIEAGPFDMRFGSAHRAQVRIAIVAPRNMVPDAIAWFNRCSNAIEPENPDGNVERFPGFFDVFRSELVVDANSTIFIEDSPLQTALALKPYDALSEVLRLYGAAMLAAKREYKPDVIVCCIPEAVEKRCRNVQRAMSPDERQAVKAAARATISAQMELPLDWEPNEAPEDLLRRDLRRALKAEAMRIEVPIQIVTNNVLIDSRNNEEACLRAWNLCVGVYYKAGGIPWRIRNNGPDTCYVGITFHHLRTTKRALVHSSLAQAFSTNGGGFALRGAALQPPESGRMRSPHMDEAQAQELGRRVLEAYVERNGTIPKRIVLHKSSRFLPDELDGFKKALRAVPVVQMISLAPSSIRLVTHATYPPARGTLLTIEDSRHFLFTSGYVRELETYPGPHIPIPVEVTMYGTQTLTDVREAAIEALGLGRLNWNTSDLRSSQPVTLGFARRVGGIMAEYGLSEEREPDPSYRYYM
ncbi:argonaute/piwi family protein [Paraburkholderia sp. RL17-347-BIC-D]|uniref:argonaute/piwi family protein n=1 Tax=Paraburkholderia sp. RL17-347-BIC-D TaxID=3031632 RepID=UPI0038BD7C27